MPITAWSQCRQTERLRLQQCSCWSACLGWGRGRLGSGESQGGDSFCPCIPTPFQSWVARRGSPQLCTRSTPSTESRRPIATGSHLPRVCVCVCACEQGDLRQSPGRARIQRSPCWFRTGLPIFSLTVQQWVPQREGWVG